MGLKKDNKDFMCQIVGTLWIVSGIIFFISLSSVSDLTVYSFFSAIFFKVLLFSLLTSDKCG
jgi:hypothetical protein